MRWPSTVLLSFALYFVGGCKHAPTHFTVMLLDVSKSIAPKSVTNEFNMADALVDKMQRDDQLILIPITGNAISEMSGRVVRLKAPLQREPYDHDLLVFRKQAHEEIRGMQEAATSAPTAMTDILGALDVAMEAFDAEPNETQQRKELILLSDLLEDDGELNFISDYRMKSSTQALTLATALSADKPAAGSTVSTSVCPLRSLESTHLAKNRQKMIIIFWEEYIGVVTHHVVTVSMSCMH